MLTQTAHLLRKIGGICLLICESCGYAFPAHEYPDGICPNCHSDDTTDAFYCEICGKYEPVSEQEMDVSFTNEKKQESEVCEAQVKRIMAQYTTIMNNEFNPDERGVIASYVFSNGDTI